MGERRTCSVVRIASPGPSVTSVTRGSPEGSGDDAAPEGGVLGSDIHRDGGPVNHVLPVVGARGDRLVLRAIHLLNDQRSVTLTISICSAATVVRQRSTVAHPRDNDTRLVGGL